MVLLNVVAMTRAHPKTLLGGWLLRVSERYLGNLGSWQLEMRHRSLWSPRYHHQLLRKGGGLYIPLGVGVRIQQLSIPGVMPTCRFLAMEKAIRICVGAGQWVLPHWFVLVILAAFQPTGSVRVQTAALVNYYLPFPQATCFWKHLAC